MMIIIIIIVIVIAPFSVTCLVISLVIKRYENMFVTEWAPEVTGVLWPEVKLNLMRL